MNNTYLPGTSRQERERCALNRVIAHFVSLSALAKALDVTYQTIQCWRDTGVPFDRCAELETLVRGAVQCHELNEAWPRVTTRPYAAEKVKRHAPVYAVTSNVDQ